jgi:hypothetical protein
MSKKGNWQTLFGAKRRTIDRALLAECEKTICQADLRDIELDIEREERQRARIDAQAREAIAKAFGRPLT